MNPGPAGDPGDEALEPSFAGVDHGEEVVPSLEGRSALVAVRDLLEGGKGRSDLFGPFVGYVPDHHRVAGDARPLVPENGPDLADDALPRERIDRLQGRFLAHSRLGCEGAERPFLDREIALEPAEQFLLPDVFVLRHALKAFCGMCDKRVRARSARARRGERPAAILPAQFLTDRLIAQSNSA